ncbi:probable phospholipid-transporting ATPase IA isoform X2 [Daktulosphaira vitifoliae]|uniref:probable phospholipid-transporting ATPase IA isoform X2 n=1 Tax=Daktulosphaira vitifoliae TaxID=58002 RepID=UPI0021A9912E|nr:probable phospholipid-transporting ATPase IA isoform X2 [Daktulosphaira vitifoliae]
MFRWIRNSGYLTRLDQNAFEDESGLDAVDCLGARDSRLININGLQRYKSCSNCISTAKYNFISFLPIFLFEQFRRYSNCFFLLIALLQQIPEVSPTGRFTTLVPLCFILLVSAVKEIIEDFKRHRADREVNHRIVEVLSNGSWLPKRWDQINVGDIVKVKNNTFFPADLLIISSSEPQSMCYIETMNLDGETNLKIRQGLPETANYTDPKDLIHLKGTIDCELPNRLIYDFVGSLKLTDRVPLPLGPNNLLLRGAMLRNTPWVCSIVIYTGHESKLMMNQTSAPLKRSTVDKIVNTQIIMLFLVLCSLCLLSAFCNIIWTKYKGSKDWYLQIDDIATYKFAFNLLTFFILFNNLIPISLQVTVEVVRFMQATFINNDIEMYHEESNTPAMARTSNLNEELGMVKYIFSDKTGTLTRNVMEFKHCSIAGILYLEGEKEILLDNLKKHYSKNHITEFLNMMAVCHTVIPEKKNSSEILYHASSPDEQALLKGCRSLGYTFHTRTPKSVLISALNIEKEYKILNVIEFSSARKRMSVIVRCPSNKILLYCKGADSVIFERLSEEGEKYKKDTLAHLNEFANSGFRTLCFAYTEISESFYATWNEEFIKASNVVNGRDDAIDKVAQSIETNLTLLGATAVEDKLQDKVPETIASLLKAGINVWVLTGDKQETAINIGYSTNLISQDTPLILLNEPTLDELRESLRHHLNEVASNVNKQENSLTLVIDGQSLKHALSHNLKMDFLELCMSCKSVICCRVSPMQKAEVVELVTSNTKQVTLAIGDGANDVAMIQKAHVGVGISGVEGLQAACASDYSIAQFKFLLKLLLVHGAWNYNRMSKLILYSFYKNICLYIMELWFAIYSGWSGQIIFERWTIGLYNVLFTAAPPLVIGIFDIVCTAKTRMEYPEIYSQTADTFDVQTFWMWVLNALIHSFLLFWLCLFSLENEVVWSNGKEGGYLVLGTFIYTYVVVVVSLKAGLHIKSWSYIVHAAIWGSIVAWFVFIIIYSHFWPIFPVGAVFYGIDTMVFRSPVFWLLLIFSTCIVLGIDLAAITLKLNFSKNLVQTLRANELNNSNLNSINQRHRINEKSRLLTNVKNVFHFKSRLQSNNDVEMNHGFAFSQEEGGVVSQLNMIRVYNTRLPIPEEV